MINVFKRMAPSYGNILRKFAIDVWYGRRNEKQFYDAAYRYKKRYEIELMKHYDKIGISYNRGMIKNIADEWLADQIIIAKKIESVTVDKKEGIIKKLDQLTLEKQAEVKKLLSARTHEGRVASVVSFETNMDAKSRQMGEDAAFELSTKINQAVIKDISDVYIWKTQNDRHVRKPHRKLKNKLFSFDDPPTTIDKYGHEHTGNPGTDWGCRCWSEAGVGKPLRGYIVRAA